MQRRQRARCAAVRQSQQQRWCLKEALARMGLVFPSCERAEAATQTTASSRRRRPRRRRSTNTSLVATTSRLQEAAEAKAREEAALQTTREWEGKLEQRAPGRADAEDASRARGEAAEAASEAEQQCLALEAKAQCRWPEKEAKALSDELSSRLVAEAGSGQTRTRGRVVAAESRMAAGERVRRADVKETQKTEAARQGSDNEKGRQSATDTAQEVKEHVPGGVYHGRPLAFLTEEDLSRAIAASWHIAETVVAASADTCSH